MKSVLEALEAVLRRPTSDALLDLQGALLASGQGGAAVERALDLTGHFHAYLGELEAKVAARDYSELASRLDIGAVGMVAVENLVAGSDARLWQRLLAGGLGEGLMVAASRQYVRAWQAETAMVHRNAAWFLAQALWDLSRERQAEMPDGPRWERIQSLLGPAHDPRVPAAAKALLLGRIFQLLVLVRVAALLQGQEARS